MKMKNMLIGGMSLALVACISIGGTLAYLTDTTGTAQNKFKMVTNGIVLNLQETAKDGAGYDVYKAKFVEGEMQKDKQVTDTTKGETLNANNAGDTVGFIYENIQPGATLQKDVKLSIGEQGTTTVSSWVFACMKNENTNLMVTTGSDWKVVATDSTKKMTLYLYQGEGTDGDDGQKYVKQFPDVKPLTSLFTTVQVPDTTAAGTSFKDITVSGYAEQVEANTYGNAYANALKHFGMTADEQ